MSTSEAQRFAYSEHVTAASLGRWHISPVDAEGLKLGGNAPAPLCWAPEKGRWSGWHVREFVTAENLDLHSDAGSLCPACVSVYDGTVIP